MVACLHHGSLSGHSWSESEFSSSKRPANSFFFPDIEDHCILDISDILLSLEPKLLQVEPTQSVKKKHSCQIKHWLAKNLDYNMQIKTLTHISITSSSCMCIIYVQYTDIVYWKSCVHILCDLLGCIVCPAPESPNNKTIITLEPIEIPFSFMPRC